MCTFDIFVLKNMYDARFCLLSKSYQTMLLFSKIKENLSRCSKTLHDIQNVKKIVCYQLYHSYSCCNGFLIRISVTEMSKKAFSWKSQKFIFINLGMPFLFREATICMKSMDKVAIYYAVCCKLLYTILHGTVYMEKIQTRK